MFLYYNYKYFEVFYRTGLQKMFEMQGVLISSLVYQYTIRNETTSG